MTDVEWESLCDGCGRCCLIKLEDEDTGQIHTTRLACKLLDVGSCRCSHYPERHHHVPDCISLNAAMIATLRWLPETCAYRLVDEGKDLAWWHPLVSGDAATVHAAGVSVRDLALPEQKIAIDQVWKYIVAELPAPTAKRERSGADPKKSTKTTKQKNKKEA